MLQAAPAMPALDDKRREAATQSTPSERIIKVVYNVAGDVTMVANGGSPRSWRATDNNTRTNLTII